MYPIAWATAWASLQILLLGSLMQSFIMTMLKLNSIIDFCYSCSLDPQTLQCCRLTGVLKVKLLIMFLNKATFDCSFVSLSPNVTRFRIVVNNDIVNMAHDFGYNGNHFGGKLCVTIFTQILY